MQNLKYQREYWTAVQLLDFPLASFSAELMVTLGLLDTWCLASHALCLHLIVYV